MKNKVILSTAIFFLINAMLLSGILSPSKLSANSRKSPVFIDVIGDVDGNGRINSADCILLRDYIMGVRKQLPDARVSTNGDVNQDGNIDTLDVAILKKYILGMIDQLPPKSTPEESPVSVGTPVSIPTPTPEDKPVDLTPVPNEVTETPQPVITPSINPTVENEKKAFTMVGDVNGDQKINSLDCVLIRDYVINKIDELPVEQGHIAADLNSDGLIDSTDINIMKKYIVGIISEFPKQ